MEYLKPRSIKISRMKKTEKLYTLEHKRNELIKNCCKEWSGLFKVPEEHFWRIALPQGLYDLLESFDTKASVLACIAFLEHKGYETKKTVTCTCGRVPCTCGPDELGQE